MDSPVGAPHLSPSLPTRPYASVTSSVPLSSPLLFPPTPFARTAPRQRRPPRSTPARGSNGAARPPTSPTSPALAFLGRARIPQPWRPLAPWGCRRVSWPGRRKSSVVREPWPHPTLAEAPIKPPASQPRNPSRPSPLFPWAPPPPEARERGSRGEAEGKEGDEKKSAAPPLLSTKKRKEDPELLLYSEPSTRRSRSPPEQATPPSREGGPAPTPPGARRRRAGAHDRLRRRSGSTCTAPTRHGSASSLRRHPSVLEPNR